jgi:pimeloyl-ACP methyl ester carboxylesterase
VGARATPLVVRACMWHGECSLSGNMRFAHVALFALAACSRPPQGAALENRIGPPAERPTAAQFEPTAFSVEVHGQGRPVILIPGLGCPGSVWSGVVEHLRHYETHQLTLAGFAGKPRIDGPLAETTIDELARYIRDRHLVAPVIIGHSLGGFVAYALAAREPALVGPTIVVDAGAAVGSGDRDADATADAAAQVRDMWRGASDEQFAQQVNDVFGSMSLRPDRLRPVLIEIAKSDRRAIGDAIYELSTTDVRNQLGKIRAPVLLVLADGGLQDEFRRQAEGVRDREVIVVTNTRHFVMLDNPEGFSTAVDGFLAKHEAVAAN